MTVSHPIRIVLVQVRRGTDPMALHEYHCIRRRLVDYPVDLVVRNARDEDPAPEWVLGADAVLIGGSGSFGLADAPSEPWLSGFRATIEAALQADTPSLAICFGHQLLGHHLGAVVRTDPERAEVGTIDVNPTGVGRSDAIFGVLPAPFLAQTGHSDHVDRVPDGVELLASNERLETQAFRVRGTQFYSTQFHPDLSAREARERYLAYYGADMPDEVRSVVDQFHSDFDHGPLLMSRFLDSVVRARVLRADAVLALEHSTTPAPPRARLGGARA